MFNRKLSCLLTICFVFLNQNLFSQIILQGKIIDNGAEYLGSGAEPVAGALVTITDQADANRTFSSYTDDQGQYSIDIPQTSVDGEASLSPGSFHLLQNYPNPFGPSTVIGYELSKPSHIRIEIYNALGQKIKTLVDGFENISSHVTWDGTNDLGRGVPSGVYIYSLKADGKKINRKMLLIDGNQGGMPASAASPYGTSILGKTALRNQLSDQYVLTVTGENLATYEQQNLEIIGSMTVDVTVSRTVTDIDGNVYPTVKIGDQWWMAENLKVTHYSNGEAIPNVTNVSAWTGLSSGAWCVYNNKTNNADAYGYLYNWYAVNDSRNIAPTGWHVPSETDWTTLTTYLGGESVAGGKIKETGTAHWYSPNTGATDGSGFSALPNGWRYHDDFRDFVYLGYNATIWSSTGYGNNRAWYRYLSFDKSVVGRYDCDRRYGFSVRLLRD